jgi:hypothetical protein
LGFFLLAPCGFDSGKRNRKRPITRYAPSTLEKRREKQTNNNNTTQQNPKIKNQKSKIKKKTLAKDRVCEQKFWQRPPKRTY